MLSRCLGCGHWRHTSDCHEDFLVFSSKCFLDRWLKRSYSDNLAKLRKISALSRWWDTVMVWSRLKKKKAALKTLLAVFLSLDKRCFRFFFSAKCSLKITNYGVMLVLQTKEPFPTKVLSDCDYFKYTGASLLNQYDWRRVELDLLLTTTV